MRVAVVVDCCALAFLAECQVTEAATDDYNNGLRRRPELNRYVVSRYVKIEKLK